MKKILFISLCLFCVTACDDLSFNTHRNGGYYESEEKKSRRGEKIDCKELVSPEPYLKNLILGTQLIYKQFHGDILSYVHEYYSFNECSREIKEKITEYCATGFTENSPLNGHVPDEKYRHFCPEETKKGLSLVNYKYVLPTADNKFIVIESLNEMFDPKNIISLSYKKGRYFWTLTIRTNDNQFELYWNSKDLWEKAILDFSKTASLPTVEL